MYKLKFFVVVLLVLFVLSPIHAQAEKPAILLWNRWQVVPNVTQRGEQLIALNLEGEVIYDLQLMASGDESVWNVGVAHNGQRMAMIVVNGAVKTVYLRVIELPTNHVILEYPLSFNQETKWSLALIGSRNFSIDDQRLAIGHYNDAETGWRILVFDLHAAELIATLFYSDDRVRQDILGEFQPVIYHFDDDIITFTARRWDVAYQEPEYSAFDWNIASGTIVPNCVHSHLQQDTFIPTNETIEAATEAMFLWSGGDAPVPFEGDFVLQLALSPVEQVKRQVFFQNSDYPLRYPTFVQGGERIVTWGTPPPPTEEQTFPPFLNRLWLIERNGVIVDQFDVRGELRLAGTLDGFLYMLIETEVGPVVNKLTYVDTRSENPFENQKVIWQREPDTGFDLIWADNQLEGPLTEFVPWGNRLTHSSHECPVFRG